MNRGKPTYPTYPPRKSAADRLVTAIALLVALIGLAEAIFHFRQVPVGRTEPLTRIQSQATMNAPGPVREYHHKVYEPSNRPKPANEPALATEGPCTRCGSPTQAPASPSTPQPEYKQLPAPAPVILTPPPTAAGNPQPFLFAVMSGDHDLVKRWLANRADVNASGADQKTALMIAAENGDHDICKSLWRGGAMLNRIDLRGRSALHYAAERGHNDVAKFLVEQGASVQIQDREGNTPLLLAERGGHNSTASIIRKALTR